MRRAAHALPASASLRRLIRFRSTEADPSVLAKYVLALLREGEARDRLEAQCLEQLDAFLGAGAATQRRMAVE